MSIIDPIFSKVKIDHEFFYCSTFLKKTKIPITDIRWAYLQIEDVRATMCCMKGAYSIYRLILRTENKKYTFDMEDREEVKKLLDELKANNPQIVIGYNKYFEDSFKNDYKEFLRLTKYYF